MFLWIKNNWQTAIELAAVAVVAFAIVIGASSYWRFRSETAAEELYKARLLTSGSEGRAEKLREVVTDYSRTPAGQQAMLELGRIYIDQKDFNKAIDVFTMLAGRSRNHPFMRIAALHRLAEVQLKNGNTTAAAETYLKAAADPANLVSTMSRFHAAECFEQADDADRAAQLYRQVMDDAKDEDRAFRNAAEERLIWMAANDPIK